MANKRNKGFSLIEIVIAIAVLTLLLTPILKQFTATMRTNRIAKEQQYANENAQYLVEYFQRTVDDALDTSKVNLATSGTGKEADDIYCPDDSTHRIVKADSVKCDVYDIDKNLIASGVKYNAVKYILNDAQLGTTASMYGRTVIVDDLSIQLKSTMDASDNTKGYVIRYGFTDSETSKVNEFLDDGYVLTSEGSLVKRNADGFVISVVADLGDLTVDPNALDLGNVQDLDATKVAIITGETTNFDTSADSAFYNMAMDALKNDPDTYDTWDQIMFSQTTAGGSLWGYNENSRHKKNITKLTKLNIDAVDEDGNGTVEYYQVSVDVYYENYFVLNNGLASMKTGTDHLSYTVFAQKFYTDRCPDIYFEYQPFAEIVETSGGSTEVTYAANDYLVIDNTIDAATENGGNEVKIYLYKPHIDQQQAYINPNVAYTDGLYKYETDINGGTLQPVKINLIAADTTTQGNLGNTKIYTNLDLSNFVTNTSATSKGKFTRDSVADDTHAKDEKALLDDTSTWKRTKWCDYTGDVLERSKDSRSDSRLYTVTVTLTPNGSNSYANTVTLSGAKGDN